MGGYLEVADGTVHYRRSGPPPGDGAAGDRVPTIVLLHGYGPDHRSMTGPLEPVFRARPRPWRRIYLDLPGMGRSTAGPGVGSTDDVFRVVREALRRLLPHGRFALCGDSYGGYLARGLTTAEPGRVTGLALLSPVWEPDRARRDVPPHTVLVRDPEALSALPPGGAFESIAVVQTRETVRRTLEEVVVGIEMADPAALRRISGAFAGTFPMERDGFPFTGPTLVVTGRQDAATGYRDGWPVLDAYPRATFAILDRAGHGVPIEQPTLLAALMHEWLDRVEETIPPVRRPPIQGDLATR